MKTLPKRHFEFNDKHDDFSTGMNTEQAQYKQRRQKHLDFKASSHTFYILVMSSYLMFTSRLQIAARLTNSVQKYRYTTKPINCNKNNITINKKTHRSEKNMS